MKGLVFTTFYSHCESRYGADFLEDAIAEAALPNNGAYTSVGTYPFDELAALLGAVARKTGQQLSVILREFGEFCFLQCGRYVPAHVDCRHLFDILASAEHFQESQLRDLYPDAEAGSPAAESGETARLALHYLARPPWTHVAVGVVEEGERIEVGRGPMTMLRGSDAGIKTNPV